MAWELCEDERPGQFDVDEARRLGVPEGPAFGELQRGGSVTAPDGTVVDARRRARSRAPRAHARLQRRHATVRGGAARGARRRSARARGELRSEDRERARETRHSTAAEAAELAAASEVKLLALTHLGARATPRMIKDEARAVFATTVVPRDFDTIELPLPERGAPELRRGGAHPGRGEGPMSEDW